jgi:chromosome segregation protein
MEMKGFKSFADKTVVEFGDDFNCILGPNGSGKSNVLDSLCFVLGKAGSKGLRAEKTANLIYNGGKSKKPAKKGEVHIWFDNETGIFPVEENDIKISRVVKTSGQSDYLINDEISTRTNIQDLLAHAKIDPDGYNIILQGDIVRLIEMSPNDRRGIIEEISGISIYEEKKEKAVRELERVEEQLKEADIVLKERKSYLTELKKERDQALKFQELDEKIKRNKKTVLSRKHAEKTSKIEGLNEKTAKEQEIIDAQQEIIDSLKEQILEKKKEIDAISREVEEKGEKEQVSLMKDAEQLRTDIALKEQRQEQLKQELARINERRDDLQSNKKETQDRIKQLQKDITEAEKRIAIRERDREKVAEKIRKVQDKNDMSDAAKLDERITEIDKEAEKFQEKISELREKQQELMREKDRIDFQVDTIDQRIQKVKEAQTEQKEQLDELKTKRAELKSINSQLHTHLDRSSEIVPELQTAKGKRGTLQESLAKLEARKARIAERAAGSNAVKQVLQLKNEKIYGTIAQLGNVSEQFSTALEIAAGGRLNSIVVDDDQTAQQCIQYLKQNRLGVATFLPLNKIRARTIPSELRNIKSSGVHGLAIDLVRYDEKFQVAFSHVLGSTLVVEDINAARGVGIGKTRMVTTDGDLVGAGGSMSGGYRKQQSSGSGFQEEELSSDIAKLEKQVADYENMVQRLSQEQEQANQKIDELRSERHEIEDRVAELERELHLDSDDVDADAQAKKNLQEKARDFEGQIDQVIEDVRQTNRELAQIKSEKQKLREKLTDMRSPQAIAELNAFETQRQKLAEEIVEIKGEKKNAQTQIETIYQPEIQNTENILEQQNEEQERFSTEKTEIKEQLVSMKEDLKEKEKKEEVFRKQFKALFDKRNKAEEQKDNLEDDVIKKEEKIRSKEHQLAATSVQLAQLKAELASVNEELKDFEQVEPYKTKSDEDIKQEIKDFERMVDNLGAVNMKALEMYEKVNEEYEKLSNKKETLNTEREDVLLMINEIDAKKRELFLKTFNVIETHFKEIFTHLSTKGEAFLELENPEDPLSEGLNIRVRLSGNKFMDIRSLSGGEKTMTALAFLTAIQEYEPASFYVLDEVDAALDKKNSERLAQMIRSYSDKAQYIIISHNDTVISEADNLYGVSMNEHGISKVTSLKI